MKYKIHGQVTIEGGEPEMPLYVCVQVGQNVVDGFSLVATGRFEKEVTANNRPDLLKVFAFDNRGQGLVVTDYHEAHLASTDWQKVDGIEVHDLKTDIPWELVVRWGDGVLKELSAGFLATYTVRGRVAATATTSSGKRKTISVPNARVEIIEYDPQRKRWWEEPSNPLIHSLMFSLPEQRDTLGVVWTDVDGNFEFSFSWYDFPFLHWYYIGPEDHQPDILLRVSQQLDGQSIQLAETETRMSLETYTDLGVIEVPIEKTLFVPNPALGSNQVKGFQAIGLLPVDGSRIKDGYASSQKDDLVQCKNAPFGGSLELYAWFSDRRVTHYRLRVAPAGTANFQDVSDHLLNYRFDFTNKAWKSESLGPSEVGGVKNLYRSIEHESGYLYDVKLKARWHTQGLAPGKYTLRLEGYRYNAGTGQVTQVSTLPSIDLRIDNVQPTAKILGVFKQGKSTPETECEIIDLKADPKAPLTVKIRVHDHEGHLGKWALRTAYGSNHDRGDDFAESEEYLKFQNPPVPWAGYQQKDVTVPKGTTSDWKKCGYSFSLLAVGRSTDGRSTYLRSQEAWFHEHVFIDAPS